MTELVMARVEALRAAHPNMCWEPSEGGEDLCFLRAGHQTKHGWDRSQEPTIPVAKWELAQLIHAAQMFATEIRQTAEDGRFDPVEANHYASQLEELTSSVSRRAHDEWPDFLPMPGPGFGA